DRPRAADALLDVARPAQARALGAAAVHLTRVGIASAAVRDAAAAGSLAAARDALELVVAGAVAVAGPPSPPGSGLPQAASAKRRKSGRGSASRGDFTGVLNGG